MMPNRQTEAAGEKFPSQYSIKKYLTIVFFIFCVILLAIFWGFESRTDFLIRNQLLKQARAYSQEITLVRAWISEHGGVYVKKRPGMSENPYLKDISTVKSAITDQDGVVYLLKNPAMATREISEMASDDRIFSFRITSLNPINPHNSPDGFETKGLRQFQDKGSKEVFQLQKKGETANFRYITPLYVEESCLQCHAAQGYKVGDIRGGISVSIPASDIVSQSRTSKLYVIISAIALYITLTVVILITSDQLLRELRYAETQLYEMATRDFLTGLLNRREGLRRFRQEISKCRRTRQSLAAMILDIDHFKKINDTYGHLAGDMVLQHLVKTLIPALRDYDIFCRYGGEEFLLVLPGTSLPEAVQIAERLRRRIADSRYAVENKGPVSLTISIGVAQLTGDEDENGLIYRVDDALYGAKNRGRNCVNSVERK